MKPFLMTTATVFGLLTIVHVWRVIAEGSPAREPFFVILTIISAALCVWSVVLLRRLAR